MGREGTTMTSEPGARTVPALGGRSGEQNYALWAERWSRGEGHGDLPYGPAYAGHWPPGWKPGDAKLAYAAPDLGATLEDHLTRVGLPERLAQHLRAGPEDWPAVAKVREWYYGGQSLLVLHGDPGTGKSVGAATVFLHTKRPRLLDGAQEWASDGSFLHATDLAGNLFADETKALLEHLGGVGVLVLDELGTETMSEPWLGALESLVNRRFEKPKLRTILCSNVSARPAAEGEDRRSPFRKRYGERIARRIVESGSLHAATKPERRAV